MPGPLLTLGLATAGSGLLNYLGGRAEAGRRTDLQQKLLELLSTKSLTGEANNLFDLLRASPMYTGLRSSAMEGSARLAGQLQTSFARRGLSNSGIAGVALPLARASHIRGFQDIDTQLFMQALAQARETLSQRANVLSSTSGPSAGQLAIGNTLQSIMPLVLQYMSKGKQ